MSWDYEYKPKQPNTIHKNIGNWKTKKNGQEFINQLYLLKPTIHASKIKKSLTKKKLNKDRYIKEINRKKFNGND